jgi:rod shape-determining protein MreC
LNFFAFDLRKALIVLIVIALPLLSINMKRSPGEEPWYRKPFSATVGVIQGGYSTFTSGVRGTTSMYLKLIGIKKHNNALQHENEEMRAQLGSMTELKLENERLKHLLDFKLNTSMKLLGAKVIARDLSLDHNSIRINRGTRDGLRRLQGVITVNGIVGYILRANYESSQVVTLTDRSAAIDAIVQRTRAPGLVSGKTNSSCRLRYLERADDVAPGDTIVTSGLQGYFPKGFPIGKLTSVRKTDYGISQEADIEPVVNPSKLEEVFVVMSSGQEDFSERFGEGTDFGPPLVSKQNPKPQSDLPAPAPAAGPPPAAPAPKGKVHSDDLVDEPSGPGTELPAPSSSEVKPQ